MRGAMFLFIFVATGLSNGPAAFAAPKAKAKAVAEAPLGPATRGPTNPGDLVGRYSVLRSGKDTGCMLTLNAANAQLAPACRDNGIVVFDPKGWSLTQRRLALRARKGHSALFEMNEQGVWEKATKDGGKPLGFRKM